MIGSCGGCYEMLIGHFNKTKFNNMDKVKHGTKPDYTNEHKL